jgi:hypothetical protein
MLTNDSSYWKVPDKDFSHHYDRDFRISESLPLHGDLQWHANASAGTKKNRDQPIVLEGRYECRWRDYSSFGTQKNAQFRYLGFAVGADAYQFDANEASPEVFDPASVQDGREIVRRSITVRRGQQAFRDKLRKAYGDTCAFSGCKVVDVLEAAHIYPYRGPETNMLRNGLLLRADLHTLFDCLKISVDPETMKVWVSPDVRTSDYGDLHGRLITSPSELADCPSRPAMKAHFAECMSSNNVRQST